nr:hypothetical protein [Tanacetum cinerariifolium]
TPAQKAAKRRRLNKEAKDVEELKQHLEIVPNEDNDVYTEATPLARKVPVVDYQIIHLCRQTHMLPLPILLYGLYTYMDPEEEDGDDEKFEGDSIDYLTYRGYDDTDDDGDDLSEDDTDDEDKEESSDSKEEKEEHLALTVPVSALHSSISASEDSDQIEPFKEGKVAATPPPSAYRVTARISVRPYIPMPFLSEEGIPEADMPLQKRARFTTPTGGYEVGESFVTVAARQIRPALTIDDSRRAEDILIGRLRRERSWTTASHERFIPVH